MPRINQRLEVVRFDPRPSGEVRVVQVAIDGRLAAPMDILEADYCRMSDSAFQRKLMQDGETLIRHFGDMRKVRYREDGSYVSLEEGS